MSDHVSHAGSNIDDGWRIWGGLFFFLAMCFGISAIAGSATSASVANWYPTLAKPSFTPPDWVFGPVWGVLYGLIAVAGWRVWLRRGFTGAPAAMALYAAQLMANLCWSLLFFGNQSPGLGVVSIVMLLGLIGLNIREFARIDSTASNLLLPYFGWVGFAAILNLSIWVLN